MRIGRYHYSIVFAPMVDHRMSWCWLLDDGDEKWFPDMVSLNMEK